MKLNINSRREDQTKKQPLSVQQIEVDDEKMLEFLKKEYETKTSKILWFYITKAEMKQKDEYIDELEVDLKYWEDKHNKLKDKKEDLDHENFKLTDKVNDLENEVDEWKGNYEYLKAHYDGLETSMKGLNRTIEKLQKEME